MAALIIDSGSTKSACAWAQQPASQSFTMAGMNPYLLSDEQLAQLIRHELMASLKNQWPAQIFFYGAGCADPANQEKIRRAFAANNFTAKVMVETDLTGAARALLNRDAGLIAILGTGSNSGWYDGGKIIRQVDSLGYLLGDEGSGFAIGRRVLAAFLRNELPHDLADAFAKQFMRNRNQWLEQIYGHSSPNRLIAGIAPFAAAHQEHADLKILVEQVFNNFFIEVVNKYALASDGFLHFAGSIAAAFETIIRRKANQFNLHVGQVAASPLPGLIRFHQTSN